MKTLLVSLRDSDAALLPVIAKRWNVNLNNVKGVEAANTLASALTEPQRAEKVWDTLDEAQRGALQAVVGAGGKMPLSMFSRLYGEVRKLGAGAIEREKPHERPASIAEALFYRGLIYEAFEPASAGARGVIFIPAELLSVLPVRRTGYEGLKEQIAAEIAAAPLQPTPQVDFDDEDAPRIDELNPDDVEDGRQADTSIIDDMVTLLAYLQGFGAEVESRLGGDGSAAAPTLALYLTEKDTTRLLPHLIVDDEERLAFLLEIGLSAGLIEIQTARAYPRRVEVRRWLESKRAAQLRTLIDAWYQSADYAELWHVSGLHPEPTGWPYNPLVARESMLIFLRDFVPRTAWWSIDDLIAMIKETEPDFQRPNGDYDSWYIRDSEGEYLHGFESWDAIEGALLEFYLLGPMHWLGMVDLAMDAARLNAYGRTFIGGEVWPSPADQEEKVVVQPDGTLLASRRVPRIDRFQLARFTTWVSGASVSGAPYTYRLDGASIQRAADQGITTQHIAAFITRMLDNQPFPPSINAMLEKWQGGPSASVSLERLIVLRTTAPETLDTIADTPALRRYLGARLGPMAAVVRADQWDALRAALEERGIQVELSGL
jgi:hypothetical protein